VRLAPLLQVARKSSSGLARSATVELLGRVAHVLPRNSLQHVLEVRTTTPCAII
jgi:hypothetical protein